MTPGGGSDLALYRRLLRQAAPYRGRIALLLAVDLAAAPLALLVPLPLLIVVDGALGRGELDPAVAALLPRGAGGAALLAIAAGLVVAVALLRQLQELASAWLHASIGERLVLDFRAALFRHVQRLSLAFHDARGATHSLYRIQWDAPAIQHVAIDGVLPFATAGVTLAGMVAVCWRIDPLLALVALAVAPVLYLVTRACRRPLRVRYRRVKDLEDRALSVVHEVLGAVRVVKAFGKEEHEERRFVRHSREGTDARVRLALLQGGFDLALGVTTAAGTALVLLLGAGRVQSGALSLGELLVVMAYLAQIHAPLRTISNKVGDIQGSLASAERAFALLDENPDVPERPDALPLVRARGAVRLERVTFGYGPGSPVLRDVDLDVAPGARVGLTGRTGAGKTTLAGLLLRFFDPQSGRILLDGHDLRDLRLQDLRRQFSIVLQEPVLFSASIAENIAYADPSAGHEAIVRAARDAHADEFIARLPDGYATQVGERGMRLSGGERQRISLARAFLKDAPLLILDEPTSSVDVATESVILAAMERLMEGRTTFLIAHRASTLEGCDRRLHLEDGRVRDATRAATA